MIIVIIEATQSIVAEVRTERREQTQEVFMAGVADI